MTQLPPVTGRPGTRARPVVVVAVPWSVLLQDLWEIQADGCGEKRGLGQRAARHGAEKRHGLSPPPSPGPPHSAPVMTESRGHPSLCCPRAEVIAELFLYSSGSQSALCLFAPLHCPSQKGL